MTRPSSEFDPNVVYGRYGSDALGETAFGASAAAYLNADQRGGTATNGKPSLTIDEAAVQLTRDRVSWGDYWGEAVSVSFAFRSTAPGDMPDDTSGFSRFSATQISATLLALQAWSDVANITFNRVGSGTGGAGAYSNSATILFGNYSSGADGAAAFAYYPYSYAYNSFDGDVWVNSSLSYNANPQMFNYGQLVLVHEIGHAIGLSHPADYNAGDDENITYAQHATYFEDSMQYTVMSYFYETYTGASYGSPYPATVMLDDIAAAQRLYGANMSTRTGDTTYGFNSNADRPWFTTTSASTPLIFAVWDAGGTDTFDFSGYSSNARIELREGYFSNVGGLTGNIAVAKGAVIENAKGGNGADTIVGNAAVNRLQGNAGSDTLTGLGGADVFVFTAGGGADIVTDFVIGTDKLDASAFGGYVSIVQSGADAVVNFTSTVSVRLTNVTASNLTNASFIGLPGEPPPPPPPPDNSLTLNGGSGNDNLVGGAGDDLLYGFAGGDTLNGRAGADTMYGGTGNDVYYVDDAGDLAIENAGEGTDGVLSSISFTLGDHFEYVTLSGSAAIDATGNELANTLNGNAGANVLSGGGGNDWIDGRGGADTMRGGLGDDSYIVDNTGDQVIEAAGEGYDHVTSAVSFTLGANVESLALSGGAAIDATGNGLDNTLKGNGGANVLRGEAGDDTLRGEGGDDRIIGGAGADLLTGGAGADVFVFTVGGGADVIYDFQVGTDRLDGSAFGQYQSLVQKGADTLITFAAGVTVLLRNVTASSLTQASFVGVTAAPVAGVTLSGTTGNDNLVGGAGDDLLYGFAGGDTLNGRAGADTMYGGTGNDVYYVDDAGDLAIENAGEGTDGVLSSISFTLGDHFEYVTLSGSAAIDATGNELANTLNGNAGANVLSGGGGNDWIDGRGGADTMRGGLGDDSYIVDNTGDQVIEAAGEGYDHVTSAVSFTLGANLESLALSGSAAIDATGNGLDNTLQGNGGANVLRGEAGDDTIRGNGGDDQIIGGAGADVLAGGAGADAFLYLATSDSGAGGPDRITDFDPLADVIDLSGIDADTSLAGNQAFAWADALTGQAGQATLAYSAAAGLTVLSLDANADGVAEFRLEIAGHVMGDGGFIL